MKKTSRNLLIPNIPKKKLLAYTLIAAAALAVFLFLWFWNSSHPVDYLIYDSQTISYDKGKVVEVLDEELQKENETSGRMLGTQKILVQMTSGAQKGRQIEINNVLSTAHNIPLSPGDSIIVKVDAPENAEPFYSVYNYDRTGGTILISIIFLLFLVFVGKSKGLRSALGIAFTLLLILFGLLPMLYHGYSPVLCCFGTILLTSTVCLSLLSGITQRTLINLASVLLGTGAVSLFYLLFTALLNLSGYNYEEAEELLVVSQNTGLGIGELLFVGVMVSSLGAVMDMTMSLSSPLFEKLKAGNKSQRTHRLRVSHRPGYERNDESDADPGLHRFLTHRHAGAAFLRCTLQSVSQLRLYGHRNPSRDHRRAVRYSLHSRHGASLHMVSLQTRSTLQKEMIFIKNPRACPGDFFNPGSAQPAGSDTSDKSSQNIRRPVRREFFASIRCRNTSCG